MKEICLFLLVASALILIWTTLFYLSVLTIVTLKVRKESRRPALVGGIICAAFGAGVISFAGFSLIIITFVAAVLLGGIFLGGLWGLCGISDEDEEEEE